MSEKATEGWELGMAAAGRKLAFWNGENALKLDYSVVCTIL